MTDCRTLQDARVNHFDEVDSITFLFEETTVALNYLRDAGLSEAGCI